MGHHHKRKYRSIGSSRSKGSRSVKGKSRPMGPSDICTSGLVAWGYVFQIGTETVAVGSPITFSNNGPIENIAHTPGNSGIEISQGGTYNIAFSVYTTNNNPQDWAVVVNGTIRSEFNSAGQSITGITSLVLSAGDTITIRNVATVPDPAVLRTANATSAQVLIYKVDG